MRFVSIIFAICVLASFQALFKDWTLTFGPTLTSAKRVSASRAAKQADVRCKACSLLVNNMLDKDVVELLRSREFNQLRVEKAMMTQFDYRVVTEELSQAIVERSCDNARTKLNRTLASACDDIISDHGTSISSLLLEWSAQEKPSKFLRDVAMITLARTNTNQIVTSAAELSPESLDKLNTLVDGLRYDLSASLCVHTLELCESISRSDTDSPPHLLSPFESASQGGNNISSASSTVTRFVSQNPPTPPYPPFISSGRPHMITSETLYPIVSGQPLSAANLPKPAKLPNSTGASVEIAETIGSGFAPKLLGVDPKTSRKDVFVYLAFPRSKCTQAAFPSARDRVIPCAFPPSSDNGALHARMFPLVQALAKLTKGLPFLSVGILNGRMNSLPVSLKALQGLPALMLHNKESRLRPQVTADFSTFQYSLESILSFISTGASSVTIRWTHAVAASFTYLDKNDIFTGEMTSEVFKSPAFQKVLDQVLEIVQAQFKTDLDSTLNTAVQNTGIASLKEEL